MHDQHVRLRADHRDRTNILPAVIAELILVDVRQDEQRAGGDDAERVAVGRGFRHRADADGAAGAALVLDHELLAQTLRQAVGENARRDVGVAAGRERHDHRHRPGRPLLRLRRSDRHRGGERKGR